MLPLVARKQNVTSTSARHPISKLLYRCKLPYITQVHGLAPASPRKEGVGPAKKKEITHINHCKVLNFTLSTLSLSPATSCSIRVSVSLILSSWLLASSLIRPFSKFKSSLTLACARPISSRRRDASLAKSLESRS